MLHRKKIEARKKWNTELIGGWVCNFISVGEIFIVKGYLSKIIMVENGNLFIKNFDLFLFNIKIAVISHPPLPLGMAIMKF